MSFLTKLTTFLKVEPTKGKKVKPSVKKAPPPPAPKAAPKPVISAAERFAAESEAKEILLSAKEEAFKIKQQALERVSQLRSEAEELQHKMVTQKTEIEKKEAVLGEKENLLRSQMKGVQTKLDNLEKQKKELIAKIEKVAQMSRDEAKKKLLDATEKKLAEEMSIMIRQAEDKIKEESDHKAREILTEAMRFGATDYVAEYTVSTVKIGDEDMKGRIIGKEGRNIRAFEKATGVDVDLDEEEVIRLSSFDSVRREIARVALERLMKDGRIQPSRIEEVVAKTKSDTEKLMFEAGEMLCRRVRVYNMPQEIIRMLGRFKYRFSYGQSMITHTIEETKIGVALAHEIGANVNIVRLGCLLHDIGKVITEEEGSHVELGVDFLKKYNIPQPVIDCVAQHHEDEAFTSTESVLVYIADAISGARPGARYEDYEEYTKRINAIEDLAKQYKGVEDVYALQAGREVRVIVSPDQLTDAQTTKLAHDLKEKIQKNLTFPGTVRVTVIREFRQVETAK